MKKRIIIFGAGFISNSLLEKLKINNFQDVIQINKKKIDLFQNSSIKKIKKLLQNNDIIIFIAARAPVKNISMLEYNIKILHNFIEAIENKKIHHFIYVSSDAVYDDSKKFITEKSNINPKSFHGLMHYYRERILSNYLNCPLCIVRPTLVYGEKDPHNGYGPNQFIRSAQNKKNIKIFGNGEELRDHVCIDTVSDAIYELIKKRYNGSINIVSGRAYSFKDIANRVIKNYKQIKLIKIARKGPMPHDGLRKFDDKLLKNIIRKHKIVNLLDWIDKKKKYRIK